jgi:hypothetical protein
MLAPVDKKAVPSLFGVKWELVEIYGVFEGLQDVPDALQRQRQGRQAQGMQVSRKV